MKKHELLLLMLTIILLVGLIGGTVYATVYIAPRVANDEFDTPIQPDYSNEKKDPNTQEEKTFTLSDGSVALLKYSHSKNLNDGKEVDVYLDGVNKEFLFEKDGTYIGFISYANTDKNESNSKIKLTEAEIRALAPKYAVAYLGDALKSFTVNSVLYQEAHDRYYVTLSKKYGEGGFATGEVCNMILESNGYVISCTVPNHVELENFNESILNGITLTDVKSFAEKEASSLFPTLQSLDLSGVNITKVDNKFVLDVSYHHVVDHIDQKLIDEYNISMAKTSDACEFMMSYYYTLEP